MRRFLFGLLALLYGCLPAPGYASAITVGAVYQSNPIGTPVALGSNNGTTSFAITTTADSPAGNLLWVWVYVSSSNVASTIPSVTDSAGDTLTAAAGLSYSGALRLLKLFYKANAAHLPLGGTITVTTTGSPTAVAAVGGSVSGVAASSPLDVAGAGSSNNNKTPTTTWGTLAQPTEIVLAAASNQTADPIAVGGGFTDAGSQALGAPLGSLATGYLIVDTPAGGTFSASTLNSGTWGAQVDTFKSK